jgi:hypothetical protein
MGALTVRMGTVTVSMGTVTVSMGIWQSVRKTVTVSLWESDRPCGTRAVATESRQSPWETLHSLWTLAAATSRLIIYLGWLGSRCAAERMRGIVISCGWLCKWQSFPAGDYARDSHFLRVIMQVTVISCGWLCKGQSVAAGTVHSSRAITADYFLGEVYGSMMKDNLISSQ